MLDDESEFACVLRAPLRHSLANKQKTKKPKKQKNKKTKKQKKPKKQKNCDRVLRDFTNNLILNHSSTGETFRYLWNK